MAPPDGEAILATGGAILMAGTVYVMVTDAPEFVVPLAALGENEEPPPPPPAPAALNGPV